MKFIPVSYRNTLLCFILTLVPYEKWKSLALQLLWVEHLGMIKRGTSVINFKRSWHEVSPAYLTSYREPGICFLQKNTWELLVTVCYEKIYYNLEVRNWHEYSWTLSPHFEHINYRHLYRLCNTLQTLTIIHYRIIHWHFMERNLEAMGMAELRYKSVYHNMTLHTVC